MMIITISSHNAGCRFCEFTAQGTTDRHALEALAAHVLEAHPKESERAKRLHDQESATVVDFPTGR